MRLWDCHLNWNTRFTKCAVLPDVLSIYLHYSSLSAALSASPHSQRLNLSAGRNQPDPSCTGTTVGPPPPPPGQIIKIEKIQNIFSPLTSHTFLLLSLLTNCGVKCLIYIIEKRRPSQQSVSVMQSCFSSEKQKLELQWDKSEQNWRSWQSYWWRERERQPQLPVILHMARQTILRLSLPLVLITLSVFHPTSIHSHCHCTPHVGPSIGKVKNITFEAQLRELSSPNCCYQFALCWLDISGRISPIVQAGLAGLGNDDGKQVGAATWGSWGFVVQSELPGQHWQQTQDGERREERRRRRTATDGDQPWRFDLIMSRQ